jgi:alanine racemase
MDQFVVDVGDLDVSIGDEVIIFGGEGPKVEELAKAAGTINYEIVTRIGGRAQRVYL